MQAVLKDDLPGRCCIRRFKDVESLLQQIKPDALAVKIIVIGYQNPGTR